MPPFSVRTRLAAGLMAAIVVATLLCLVGAASAQGGRLLYKGQVLYRANKKPAPGLLVELVEAESDGKPTDALLGSTHADAEGRFTVALEKGTNEPVTLVVSAVRESAASGGDRRGEGYSIKTRRVLLGYLPHPSATNPNTVLIERRTPGRGSDESDD